MNTQLLSNGPANSMWIQIWTLSRTPIILAILITPIRFTLEMAGFPEEAIFIFGALWLTLAAAIYWGIKLAGSKDSNLILLICLVILSPISRLPVAILWWVDHKWEIGSHYGLYYDNFQSALLNQIGYGSLIQIIPGFIVGLIAIAITKIRSSARSKS